jgi:carbonic anhydrase
MDIVYRFDPHAPIQLKRPKSNKEALAMLQKGNDRYCSMIDHLHRIAEGESPQPIIVPVSPVQLGLPIVSGLEPMHAPFALVLGCADARVPIEHILDCSANDLFVVRVAGNVLGVECIGSVDYAATALRSSLQSVIVMGHTGCGAVSAAVDVYLSPSAVADIAFSHPVRSLIDRIMVSVRLAAWAIQEVKGEKAKKQKNYRELLIATSCFLNSAITAFDLQREVNSVTKGLQVSFTVYDMGLSRIQPTPVQKDGASSQAFLPAPSSQEKLLEFSKNLVACLML